MKRAFLIGFMFIGINYLFAQQIVGFEYYIDNEILSGNGHFKSVPAGNDISDTLVIDFETMNNGLHNLYVRAVDSNGACGLMSNYVFFVYHQSPPTQITSLQYYVDDIELISGSGHVVAVAPGLDVSIPLDLASFNLIPGVHRLYTRVKDETGRWSLLSASDFVIESQNPVPIKQYEYFVDNEIQTGNGHFKPVSIGTEIQDTLNINTDTLNNGLHNLYVRAVDSNGVCGLMSNYVFFVYHQAPPTQITTLQYYVDDIELISGSGHLVAITPGLDVSIPLDLESFNLIPGVHRLYTRVKDETGRWSLLSVYDFVISGTPVYDIAAMEYFIDGDPGFGNGNPIIVSPGKDVAIPFDISVFPCGKHDLIFRVMNSDGVWSLTHKERIYLLNLKAMLEGPFNNVAGNMNTTLNNAGLLPLNQPYDSNPAAQWYYTGTDSVQAIPEAQVVDWVLVQIRDAATAAQATPATIRETKPAFLMSDGSIVDLNGSPKLLFKNEVTQNMFVCVFHRNHAGLMTSGPVPQSGAGAGVWDFTTGPDKVYGGIPGSDHLSPTLWGMISGDGNGDGQTNNKDKNDEIPLQLGQTGYKSCDFNLDGEVNADDKSIYWKNNSGKGTQIPE
jgi:hypothetical protein